MSFRTSLSGLDAAATDLSVIGNNIANASTNGFKASRTEFADIFATSFAGVASNTPGSGVQVASITQEFSQGNVEFTSNSLDLALSGDGFFIVDDGGTSAYTRAGAFSTDKDGFVVDSSGRKLQVFPANYVNGEFNSFNTGSLSSLELSTGDSDPQATSSITPIINVDASQDVPTNTTFSPNSADSFNHSTSTTVYDSIGNSYPATMYYAKTSTPNQWEVHTYVNGGVVPLDSGDNSFILDFDSGGNFSGASSNSGATTYTSGNVTFGGFQLLQDQTVAFNATTNPGIGSANLNLSFNYSDATQFGGDFAVNSLNQDGFASGRLSGISVDETGAVSATFTNGQSKILGQVALAKFPNNNGLRQLGSTSWAETFSAGDRVLGAAGTASFGVIQSGALEASTVDIATQLVSLIVAQRNFEANAKAISTENDIQTTIINIR